MSYAMDFTSTTDVSNDDSGMLHRDKADAVVRDTVLRHSASVWYLKR